MRVNIWSLLAALAWLSLGVKLARGETFFVRVPPKGCSLVAINTTALDTNVYSVTTSFAYSDAAASGSNANTSASVGVQGLEVRALDISRDLALETCLYTGLHPCACRVCEDSDALGDSQSDTLLQ